jgi:MOSC domain-containing protein YiiM
VPARPLTEPARQGNIDLDLSMGNLPAGSLLAVGRAVVQVSDAPHLGCAKFVERFGAEAMRFVNSGLGRQLRLRGMNARVLQPGIVRPGDIATRPRVTARQP